MELKTAIDTANPFLPHLLALHERGISMLPTPLEVGDICEKVASDFVYREASVTDEERKTLDYYKLFNALREAATMEGTERLSKKFRKVLRMSAAGLVLSDKSISVLMERYTNMEKAGGDPLFVDLANPDEICWSDGQYGHHGSCWWNPDAYGDYLATFVANGGWAVREYEKNSWGGDVRYEGVGRTWLFPHKDTLLFFNRYLHNDTMSAYPVAVAIAKEIQALAKQKVHIWNVSAAAYWYTNNTGDILLSFEEKSAYMVTHPDMLDTYYSSRVPRFTVNVPQVRTRDWVRTDQGRWFDDEEVLVTCQNCGARVTEEDSCSDDNGNTYCSDCYGRLFFSCRRCGEEYDHDQQAGDTGYCEDCAHEKGYYECESCNEWTQDVCDCEGTSLCEDCRDNEGYAFCEKCEEYRQDTSYVEAESQEMCEDCRTNYENEKQAEQDEEDAEIARMEGEGAVIPVEQPAEFQLYLPLGVM